MKKPLFCLLLLSFIYLNSYGQGYNTLSGYLVTYEQDTIHGLIKDRANLSEKILFKAAKETDFKEYTPSEIELFYFYGGYYNNRNYYYKAIDVPIENKIEKLFLLCLVEGDLSLYAYKNYYFVGKSLDSLVKLEKNDLLVSSTAKRDDKRYIGHLKYLTKDCASIQSVIEKTSFKPDDLSKVVIAYNQCINPSSKILVSKRTKRKLHAGVRVSTVISKADYFVTGYDINTYPFSSKIGYSAGLYFQLPFKNKIIFQPELLITQKGAIYRRQITSTAEEKIDFNLTYLQVPFSVYYTFPTYKIRPFVAAGGIFSFILSSKSYQSIGTRRNAIQLDSKEVGYRLSAGLSYPAFNNRMLSLEYGYENNYISKTVVNYGVHLTSHNISLRMNF